MNALVGEYRDAQMYRTNEEGWVDISLSTYQFTGGFYLINSIRVHFYHFAWAPIQMFNSYNMHCFEIIIVRIVEPFLKRFSQQICLSHDSLSHIQLVN